MKNPPSQKSATWQDRRAHILDRICRNIKAAKARGIQRQKAIRGFSRYWNGRKLDTRHTLKLSESSLRRNWDIWLKAAETPAAFRLHFRPGKPKLSPRIIVRLVKFLVAHPQRSFRAGCLAFAALPANRHLKPMAIYWAAERHIPGSFKMIKTQQRAISAARTALKNMREAAIANLRDGVPSRFRKQ